MRRKQQAASSVRETRVFYADEMRIYDKLLAYEMTRSHPPDGRRIIRDERQRLHSAIDRVERLARSKRHVPHCWTQEAEKELTEARERLDGVETEARRVLSMWEAGS